MNKKQSKIKRVVNLTTSLLRQWPLPQAEEGDDKEGRGRIFVVGGSAEIPGAILLAAVAALRAGAGQLKIATVKSIAPHVAMAVPEAWTMALPETVQGGIDPACADELAENANNAHAVLFGPGMLDPEATAALLRAVLPKITKPTVVLDAAALAGLCEDHAILRSLGGNVILTPHGGEMAAMRRCEKAEIKADPERMAHEAAAEWQAVVALKGSETYIAAPDGRIFRNRHGNIGLATSGSGDTLAGIIAGLAARGADPVQAAAWAVYLHARAGDILAQRMGLLGFLARELLAEIPPLMHRFNRPDGAA